MDRRAAAPSDRPGPYAGRQPDGTIPEAVTRWQEAVHRPGLYDLEVDTAVLSPSQCAALIARRLEDGPAPTAWRRLADGAAP